MLGFQAEVVSEEARDRSLFHLRKDLELIDPRKRVLPLQHK